MVQAQQIEEEKLKENYRKVKRDKIADRNFSNSMIDGQGHFRFWHRFSGQGSSNAPSKFNKYIVPNPKTQAWNGSQSSFPILNCNKCGSKHGGKCLDGTVGFHSCGKNDHNIEGLSDAYG